jgi:hypothetical protein
MRNGAERRGEGEQDREWKERAVEPRLRLGPKKEDLVRPIIGEQAFREDIPPKQAINILRSKAHREDWDGIEHSGVASHRDQQTDVELGCCHCYPCCGGSLYGNHTRRAQIQLLDDVAIDDGARGTSIDQKARLHSGWCSSARCHERHLSGCAQSVRQTHL